MSLTYNGSSVNKVTLNGTNVASLMYNGSNNILKQPIAYPVQSGSLTYNGSYQTPTWSNYDTNKMTLSSVSSQLNAGTYYATFTPKEGYAWNDGTTGGKSIAWSIGKATATYSSSSSSVSVGAGSSTSVSITKTGDSTTTYASVGNSSIASASATSSSITITGKSAGSTSVTWYPRDTNNYTYPGTKSISVTVQSYSSTFANNTPELIQMAVKAGVASSLWDVGDKIPINLSGTINDKLSFYDSIYYAYIIGFNHNKDVESDGGYNMHMQFGKTAGGVDICFSTVKMNNSASNTLGWSSSICRNTYCSKFLTAMPAKWREVITECTKYSGYFNSAYASKDKIWLLAEWEISGANTWAMGTEKNYQTRYEYYANSNSRMKYYHNKTSDTIGAYWWLRSKYYGNDTDFCLVTPSGNIGTAVANQFYGFVPCFQIS